MPYVACCRGNMLRHLSWMTVMVQQACKLQPGKGCTQFQHLAVSSGCDLSFKSVLFVDVLLVRRHAETSAHDVTMQKLT